MAGLPEISSELDLTMDAAVEEYIELNKKLHTKVFPQGGDGWMPHILERFERRMNFLRTVITDGYIELISDEDVPGGVETEIDGNFQELKND